MVQISVVASFFIATVLAAAGAAGFIVGKVFGK